MDQASPAYYRLHDPIHDLVLRVTLRQTKLGRENVSQMQSPSTPTTESSPGRIRRKTRQQQRSRQEESEEDSDSQESTHSGSTPERSDTEEESEAAKSAIDSLKTAIQDAAHVGTGIDSSGAFGENAENMMQVIDIKWQQKRFGPQEVVMYAKDAFPSPGEEKGSEHAMKQASAGSYEQFFQKLSPSVIRKELSRMPKIHIYSMTHRDNINEGLLQQKLNPLKTDNTESIGAISTSELYDATPNPNRRREYDSTVMYILAAVCTDKQALLEGKIEQSLYHIPLAFLRAKPEEQLLEMVPGFSVQSSALGVLSEEVEKFKSSQNKHTSLEREQVAEQVWTLLDYDTSRISSKKTETTGMDPVLVAFGDALTHNCSTYYFRTSQGSTFQFMIQNAFNSAQAVSLPHPAARAALEASAMSGIEKRDRLAVEEKRNRIAWSFTPPPTIDAESGIPSIRLTVFAEIVAAWDFDSDSMFVHWELWTPPGGGWKREHLEQGNEGYTQICNTVRRKWRWVDYTEQGTTLAGPDSSPNTEEPTAVAQYCYPVQFSLIWDPSQDDIAMQGECGLDAQVVPGMIASSSMPILYITVFATDSDGHYTPVGYTFYKFPRAVGSEAPQLDAWSPQTSIREQLRHWFLGASAGLDAGNLISDESLSGIPRDIHAKAVADGSLSKYGIGGRTTGKVGLRFYSISQSIPPQMNDGQMKRVEASGKSSKDILADLRRATKEGGELRQKPPANPL
eukprot:gb/GECG01000628.1/.p1 GENE.gb/GECG01000628.1/~~gb/GECG01000628.1/.p1  ORF type:complete len:736 (+),score=105.24 gb/GECG01000628.1/:1-2208(+)